MTRFILAAVLSTLLTTTVFAYAADPATPDIPESVPNDKARAIHQLLQTTHAMASAKVASHAMAKQLTTVYRRSHRFTSGQMNILAGAVQDFMDQYFIESGKVESLATRIYAQHFTTAEIQDLSRFYRTPTGQKIIKLKPTIVRQIVQQTATFMQQNQDALNEFVRKRLEAAGYDLPSDSGAQRQ